MGEAVDQNQIYQLVVELNIRQFMISKKLKILRQNTEKSAMKFAIRGQNKCETLYRKKCETKWRDNCYDIDVPYEEDVCVDKDIAVCKKHWQCSNPSLPLSECNDKVWVDNKNECEYLKKSFCDKVQKYRKEQTCDPESWQDCKNQPYEKCNKITHNNCKNVCKDVPYEVHSKEPKQITRRRPFRVCNGSNKPV